MLRQQSVGKVAIALLLLQLRLHHVGMCRFAGALPLLGQLGEAGGFARGASGHIDLVVGGQRLVEEAGHGIDQSAAGNLELRRGHGMRSSSSRNRGHLLQSQRLGDDALAGIFAHRIVGDEARSRLAPDWSAAVDGAVRLGIQSLVVITDVRQQSSASDGVVQCGDTRIGHRSGEAGLVGTSQRDGLLQSYRP